MRTLLVILVALAACHSKRKPVEPQLGGGESPAAFQRSIGVTLLRTGEPRRALPYLERYARLEPQRAEPLAYLGRAYLDLEMWQQARETLEHAISLEPKFAPAYDLLGVLSDTRGDHAGALVAHRRAIALAPGNPGFRNNLGFSLYLARRYVDAVDAYRASLRITSNAPRVHNNIGFALAKLGRFDEASEHFRLGGSAAEAANNLGLMYEERGELDQAYEAYVAAVQADPDLAAAQGNLERVASQLHKPVPRRN